MTKKNFKEYLDNIYFNVNNEKFVMDFLKKNISDLDIMIDLGASFGVYTRFFADDIKCKYIYSFEPDNFRFENLTENIEKWSKKFSTEITAFNKAAYSSNTIFNFKTNHTNISGKLSDKSSSDTYEVESIVLDEIFSFKNKYIFIKIDIEGAEYEAVNGMLNLIKNNNVEFLLEVHKWGDPLKNGGFPHQILLKFIKLGYKAIKIDGRYFLTKNQKINSQKNLKLSYIYEFIKYNIRKHF